MKNARVRIKEEIDYQISIADFGDDFDRGYLAGLRKAFELEKENSNVAKPVSRYSVLGEVRHDLEEFMKGIDGRIDGHSWGTQETGKSKVSIEDLQEIYNEIEEIFKKHFA